MPEHYQYEHEIKISIDIDKAVHRAAGIEITATYATPQLYLMQSRPSSRAVILLQQHATVLARLYTP